MLHNQWGRVDKEGNPIQNRTEGCDLTMLQQSDIVLRNNLSSSEDSSRGGSWIDEVNSFDESSRPKTSSDSGNLNQPTDLESKFTESRTEN